MNKNLIFKLFIKNKPLIISSIALFILLVAYLVLYMTTSSANSYIYFAKDTLMLSQIFFIAFLFISYEFFYLSKSSSCKECIGATCRGEGAFLRGQFLVLISLSVLFCITIFICHIAFYFLCGNTDVDFIIHMGFNILLNFFLMSIIAILFACIDALLFKRLPAYLIIFVFIILTGPTFRSLFANTKLYQIYDFFNFFPYLNFMPNHGFGFSLLPYRWARVLFWVFLFAAILLFQVKRYKKYISHLMSGICIVLALSMIIVYAQPVSKVDMSEHYQLQEMEYYKEHKQQVKNADFRILSYDMKFDIKQILKAEVDIYVDKKNLKEYNFTLYHGYHIQEVFDQHGNPLLFNQDGDYLMIDNNSALDVSLFKIKYTGYSNTFYSNSQGIYLSGAFPYYPKAGFYNLYIDNLQSYTYSIPDDTINFRVEFTRGSDKVYSNLDKQKDGVFTGKSKGATFLKGFYTTKNIDGIELVYPYLATELITEEVAREEIKNLTQSSIYSSSLRKILSIPNMNNYGYAPVYDNYMELLGITRLRELYECYFIDDDKHWLYEVYNYYTNDKEQFYSIAESELKDGYEYEVLANPMISAINRLGEKKTVDEIVKYLYDSSDTRSPSKFLNDLVNVREDT